MSFTPRIALVRNDRRGRVITRSSGMTFLRASHNYNNYKRRNKRNDHGAYRSRSLPRRSHCRTELRESN